MKIKRIVLMLVFVIIITAIPILASVGNGNGNSNGQNTAATLTFSVYGYGMLRAARTNGSPLTYGAVLPHGTHVNFTAEESATVGFEFVGWVVNGELYMAPLSLTHTVVMEGDTHVEALFDPPCAPDYLRTIISDVSISVAANGGISITVPGYENVSFEYYLIDNEIELALTPPAGRRFANEPTITAIDGLDVTFGPIMRDDGRMLLAITQPNGNIQTPVHALAANTAQVSHTVTYNLAGGRMPTGVPTTQTLVYNSVINDLPIPNRDGYMFAGWKINNQLAATPIQVRSNLTLTAHWVRAEAQAVQAANEDDDDYSAYTPRQYAVSFNPAPGAFTGNETGIRIGTYNTAITNLPNAPTRTGYTFGGWRLPNGNIHAGAQLTISGDMTLTAVWAANPAASPSPTPTPTPTPAPGGGARPNPQTNPLYISFMIFGITITAGLAAFGILVLAKKHILAEEQYRSDVARFNREQRIVDMIEE